MATPAATDYSAIIPTPPRKVAIMNKAKQLLATTLFTVVVVILASLAYKPAAHSSVINPGADLQVITITAHRMTAEQKAAYDQEQASMPVLTVTAKAMSAAEKAAFDRAQASAN